MTVIQQVQRTWSGAKFRFRLESIMINAFVGLAVYSMYRAYVTGLTLGDVVNRAAENRKKRSIFLKKWGADQPNQFAPLSLNTPHNL